MSYVATSLASAGVSFSALIHFVSHLVTPETHSLVTFKWLVRVLSTNVAVHLLPFVRTIACKVPKNAAVITLECRVHVLEIPHSLPGQLVEVIAAFWIAGYLFLVFISKVHIAFQGTTRHDEIWIVFRVKAAYSVRARVTPLQNGLANFVAIYREGSVICCLGNVSLLNVLLSTVWQHSLNTAHLFILRCLVVGVDRGKHCI